VVVLLVLVGGGGALCGVCVVLVTAAVVIADSYCWQLREPPARPYDNGLRAFALAAGMCVCVLL
jgi:hypothetical protein